MKNKWYEVLGAGLLSVSTMFFCTSLMVTGCSSSDSSSVAGGDTEEYFEDAKSGNDEEIEPSEVEESSKSEETSKEEVVETADTEEASKAEEPSSPEETVESEKPAESEEPAKSGDAAEPEESAEPNKAEPTETAEPAETTEENPEQAEPSNSEEKTEPIESAEPEPVELNNAKEWEIIRDSVTAVVENNSIQDLHESRFLKVERSDKSSRLDEYRMPEDEFVAEYQYDGYDQHLTDRLYEDGILWEGFNWTNLNKPECRFKAELDSILVHWSWPVSFAEIEATYNVRYFCQSLGLEGNVSIWIPVRYRAKQD